LPSKCNRIQNTSGSQNLRIEKEIGHIQEGKRADRVILSENPFNIDPGKIKDIKITIA